MSASDRLVTVTAVTDRGVCSAPHALLTPSDICMDILSDCNLSQQ